MSQHDHNIQPEEYYKKYINSTECLCICGNKTNFINLFAGYRKFCCQNCARRNTLNKTKLKYNVDNISQVPHVKEKMKQSIKTNWDNIDKSNRNYRILSVNESVDIYCKENNLVKLSDLVSQYGTGFAQSDILNIKYIKYKNRLLVPIDEVFKIEKYKNIKNNTSLNEVYLYKLVKLYYPDALSNQKILGKKELDIYVPSINLGIEYNGIYWHSIEAGKPKEYHLNKSLLCREKGIRLIHIYEFEDIQKQLQLLIDYLQGNDNYPKDFNKNNFLDNIPKPEIIYQNTYTIYGAGKLQKIL